MLISYGSLNAWEVTYRHCNNEVGLSLLEAKTFGYDKRSKVGDDSLDNEDDRDYSEICQLLSCQLRRKLGKDCIVVLAQYVLQDVICA
jgi:hypothetical protein